MSGVGPVGPERKDLSNVERVQNDPNLGLEHQQFDAYAQRLFFFLLRAQGFDPYKRFPADALKAKVEALQKSFMDDPKKAIAAMNDLVKEINKQFESFLGGSARAVLESAKPKAHFELQPFHPIVPGMSADEEREAVRARLVNLQVSTYLTDLADEFPYPFEARDEICTDAQRLIDQLQSGGDVRQAWEGYRAALDKLNANKEGAKFPVPPSDQFPGG